MRAYVASLHRVYPIVVPSTETALERAVTKHLFWPNVRYLRAMGRHAPRLSRRAARYGRDRDEAWLTIPWAVEAHTVDCEDAASWLAAEDYVMRGIDSRPYVYRSRASSRRGPVFHVVTARPLHAPPAPLDAYCIGRTGDNRYRLIDPSRYLGMGQKGHERS